MFNVENLHLNNSITLEYLKESKMEYSVLLLTSHSIVISVSYTSLLNFVSRTISTVLICVTNTFYSTSYYRKKNLFKFFGANYNSYFVQIDSTIYTSLFWFKLHPLSKNFGENYARNNIYFGSILVQIDYGQ